AGKPGPSASTAAERGEFTGCSGLDIGHQLHLQDDHRILDLQLALLQAAQLELVEAAFLDEGFDHGVETAMLEHQLGNATLDRFLGLIRIRNHRDHPECRRRASPLHAGVPLASRQHGIILRCPTVLNHPCNGCDWRYAPPSIRGTGTNSRIGSRSSHPTWTRASHSACLPTASAVARGAPWPPRTCCSPANPGSGASPRRPSPWRRSSGRWSTKRIRSSSSRPSPPAWSRIPPSPPCWSSPTGSTGAMSATVASTTCATGWLRTEARTTRWRAGSPAGGASPRSRCTAIPRPIASSTRWARASGRTPISVVSPTLGSATAS